MERVGDGDQSHRLVMRHVGAHDGERSAFRQARRRVIQRLVPAILAADAEGRETPEVAHRGGGIDHRGERRRIGRDHGAVPKSTLIA